MTAPGGGGEVMGSADDGDMTTTVWPTAGVGHEFAAALHWYSRHDVPV